MILGHHDADSSRPLDKRLSKRHRSMEAAAALGPDKSFPLLFTERATLDGAYSFFANERVTPRLILERHAQTTAQRCEDAGDFLAISDTTDLAFGGDRRTGLGKLNDGGSGFFCHCTLAVGLGESRRVMGVLNSEFIVRPEDGGRGETKLTRRQIRDDPQKETRVWMLGIKETEYLLAGRARAIHVMDRGADAYENLAEMDELGILGVLRASHDRFTSVNGEKRRLFAAAEKSSKYFLSRDVFISRRAQGKNPKERRVHPARDPRVAQLDVRAMSVALLRPTLADHVAATSVHINVVRVTERNTPAGETPVEWLLLTNLPIETAFQVERVVDIYRARWVIEEFFKALKSGCAVEARQLETGHSLMNMTAFFLPIAAKLLEMRGVARDTPEAPAIEVISAEEVKVLRALTKLPLPPQPTVKDVVAAIAKLGGHLKSNGPPGWAVLSRGYVKLLQFIAMRNRCAEQERCPG